MSQSLTGPDVPNDKLSVAEALSSARETRALLIGNSVLSQTGRIFKEQFPANNAVIVGDEPTFNLAGDTVMNALRSAGVVCKEPFIYRDPNLYAEFRYVEELESRLKQDEAISIAVGSGT